MTAQETPEEIQAGSWVTLRPEAHPPPGIPEECFVVGRTQGGQWVLEDSSQQLLRFSDTDFRTQWTLAET